MYSSQMTPTTQPIYEPTNEYEPEPEIFSVQEPKSEPEPEPETWPEPQPEWNLAFKQMGIGWHFHIYTFGTIYCLICTYASFLLISYISKIKCSKRGSLTCSLLIMSMIFAMGRSISLFGDPYSTSGIFNPLFGRLLWTLVIPFLLSSFSLVLLVLLDTTKFKLGPPRFQQLSTILSLTLFHFVLILTSDILVYHKPSSKVMIVICQCFFILYGFIIAIGFLYTGYKIRSNCPSTLLSGDSTSLSSLVNLCFVSSGIGLAIVTTHIYGSVDVFGVYSEKNYVDTWSWWGLQTAVRSEEILESVIVIIVASKSALSKSKLCEKCCCICCRHYSNRVKPISLMVIPNTTAFTDYTSASASQ